MLSGTLSTIQHRSYKFYHISLGVCGVAQRDVSHPGGHATLGIFTIRDASSSHQGGSPSLAAKTILQSSSSRDPSKNFMDLLKLSPRGFH